MSRKDACEKWERQRREEREAAAAAMGTCRRAVLLNLVFIAIESHLNNFGLLFDRFVLLKFNLLVGKQLNASICYVNVSLSLSVFRYTFRIKNLCWKKIVNWFDTITSGESKAEWLRFLFDNVLTERDDTVP